jgi:uncharacterized iron-regulated protein
MKVKLLVTITILLIIIGVNGIEEKNYKLYDSDYKGQISLDEMADKLIEYDVVFFGELHDSTVLHKLEIDLLKRLYNRENKLVISMEMFERDVQDVVDNYLADRITVDEFLENSRPWPNYSSDYKPLIDFAKEKKLQLVAANIPRRYAKIVNMQGWVGIENLPKSERKYVSSEMKVLDNEYKKRFFATMKSNMAMGGRMPMKMNLDNIYAAQCIKDDTMAESIAQYYKSGTKIIHYNGKFHSDAHLGTVNKLHILRPELKIAVISAFEVDDLEVELTEQQAGEGEFIVLFKNKTK